MFLSRAAIAGIRMVQPFQKRGSSTYDKELEAELTFLQQMIYGREIRYSRVKLIPKNPFPIVARKSPV